MRHTLLSLSASGAVLCSCAAPTDSDGHARAAEVRTAASTTEGRALYAQHCAVCHGEHGEGDTAVAAYLSPRPLPFRAGKFVLVGTTNGVPSEDDLVATLRHGMPGSTMMAWDWLPESDLRALAHEVRRLAVEGAAADLRHRTGLAPVAAHALADREFQPGPAVTLDLPPPADDHAAGQRLFVRHCAGCHGEDARGLPATAGWPRNDDWLWPRDLTRGALRGGTSRHALATRITAGMPGVYMPPTRLSGAELGALVDFLSARVGDGERHHRHRTEVRVERLAALPPPDAAPSLGPPKAQRLPTSPVRWHADACTEVLVAAAHDGRDLLLHVEWADASRDDRPRPDQPMGDGIAVQFTADREPPPLAMGSAGRPVNVWRWHAYDPHSTAGMTDVLLPLPHRGLDAQPPFGPAPRAESIETRGVATVAGETGNGRMLAATAKWDRGRWTVTFRRPLRGRGTDEVSLEPGTTVSIALAVWDGRVDRHAGAKVITTWHRLELAP